MKINNVLLFALFLLIHSFGFAQDILIDDSGNVGIGTTTPSAKLDVVTSIGDAVVGESTDGVGIYGASQNSYAGYFRGDTRVTGVLTVDGNLTGTGIGDITSVQAGSGLAGGGLSGDVTLNIQYAGTGLAASASSSDHEHDEAYINEGQTDAIDSTMVSQKNGRLELRGDISKHNTTLN